jgi:hemolysin D
MTRRLFTRPSAAEAAAAGQIALFRSETAALVAEPDPPTSRLLMHAAAGLLLAGFAGSAVMHVDRVVTATGQITSLRSTEAVQSFDNAIVQSLDVREGDRVRKGQVLATLDPTFAEADVQQLQVQIESLDAEIARLQAEQSGKPLTAALLPVRYAEIQEALWQQRRDQRDQQVQALEAKIAEAKATIAKYRADTVEYTQRLAVTEQIEAMRQKLYQHQDESKMTYLQAVDQRLELQRNLAYEQNALIESQHQLEAATADRAAFLQQWQAQVDTDLMQRRTARDAALGQLAKASRHDDLVVLRAPSDAVVLQRAQVSAGSVLKEATTLYTLTPLNAPLEAEIVVDAKDVGFVRTGDPVTVKVDAYDYLEHGAAEGHLSVLSGNSFTPNAETNGPPGRPYYKGHVTLDRVHLTGVPQDFRLVPGMTVTADIRVGKRTLLGYLVQGALRNLNEAMREP